MKLQRQDTVDLLKKILLFCTEQERSLGEIALHIGKVHQEVYGYLDRHFYEGDGYFEYMRTERSVKNKPMLKIKALKYPYVPKVISVYNQQKVDMGIERPNSQFLDRMFGYTDYKPPLLDNVHSHNDKMKPAPRSYSNQRVWVSGSTLSSIYIGA